MHRLTPILGGGGLLALLVAASLYLLKLVPQFSAGVVALGGGLLVLIYIYQDFPNIRRRLLKRSSRYALNLGVLILIVLGVIVLIELISVQHPQRYDLTETRRYSLSNQSKKLLRSLPIAVKAIAFLPRDVAKRLGGDDLLRQYAYHSNKFTYEFIDPDRDPGRAKQHGVTELGALVLVTKDKEEKVNGFSEEKLTNGILKVTRKGEKSVYFIKGHGEHDLADTGKTGYSSAKKAIDEANYRVKDLLLLTQEEIPPDANILVVAGPKKNWMEIELTRLRQFIKRGGKLLFLINPGDSPTIATWLEQFGILLGNNIIVDPLSRLFGASAVIPVVSQYEQHPITKGFAVATFFPLARLVGVQKEPPPGISAQVLAKTSPNSWAEVDQETLMKKGEATFQEGKDQKGPIGIAALATVDPQLALRDKGKGPGLGLESMEGQPDKKARLVVFGDSDFVTNAYLSLSGNRDLFLNTISWLAEEEELIAIRPRDTRSAPVLLSSTQGRVAFALPVIVLPALVLLTGVVACVQRRRRG